jgi:glycine cleavage system aminomethyltransferase T
MVGDVTSAVQSPRFGPIALAVLKRPHHEPGTSITIRSGDQSVRGMVAALPFSE